MRLTLKRFHSTKDHTLGLLLKGEEFLCFALEDGPRDVKVPGETRIPAGSYRVTLRKEGGFHHRYSAQHHDIHRGMLWLRNVPGFEYILLHIGNRPKDTRGCILVGDSSDMQGFIGRSTNAYRRVYPPIAAALEDGKDVWIDVEDT